MAIFSKEYTENQLELLTENDVANAVNNIKSCCTHFYSHCIKWVAQPHMQRTSIVNTVINNSINVSIEFYNKKTKKINKNVVNRVNNNIEHYFELGKSEASLETNMDVDKFNWVFNDFPNIESISNTESVRQWLISYANDQNSIDIVNNKK